MAKWVKEEERVVCVRKEERVPLKLTKTLVASSFGLFASCVSLSPSGTALLTYSTRI